MNGWDKYFLDVCNAVAKNSKCLSRHVGCVLVRDKSIISQGYNGPPRGVPHCGDRYFIDSLIIKELVMHEISVGRVDLKRCPRYTLGYKSGEGLHLCNAGHAERNVLISAARFGISTKDAKLYCDCGTPCGDCLIEIINAGIEEIIVTHLDLYDEKSKFLLSSSGIKIRTYQLQEEK